MALERNGAVWKTSGYHVMHFRLNAEGRQLNEEAIGDKLQVTVGARLWQNRK